MANNNSKTYEPHDPDNVQNAGVGAQAFGQSQDAGAGAHAFGMSHQSGSAHPSFQEVFAGHANSAELSHVQHKMVTDWASMRSQAHGYSDDQIHAAVVNRAHQRLRTQDLKASPERLVSMSLHARALHDQHGQRGDFKA